MKSHTKIFLFTTMDMWQSIILKINSINSLYLIFNKVSGYFEEINENKYLKLFPTNESKEMIKKYEWLWSKIRDFTILINKTNQIIMMKNIWKSNLIGMVS